jgi:hypothetical protein
MLLHTTSVYQPINWWKKWIDFVEIKFDSNENIESHCMHLEFNWIEFLFSFKFNLTIQLRFNWKKIECKLLEKVLKKYGTP